MRIIEETTNQINEGTVTEDTLTTLDEQDKVLEGVVEEVREDPEKAANDFKINPENLEEKTKEVKNSVDEAIDTVDKKLNPGSNGAVIAVGVIGGLIVVMLVATGGYVAHKKHQERKNRQNLTRRNDNVLQESGQSNPTFQLEPQPAPTQPPLAPPRPTSVLPRVVPRTQPDYNSQHEAGYTSDASSRYPSMPRATPSHARSHAGPVYHPPRSNPRGLRRMDP